MRKIGVGIIGAGIMADRMAATLVQMEDVDVRAVAARDAGRAREFAAKHGIPAGYGSYADLVADASVELVYIATPNTFHRDHCRLCLDHGKHVLCEKPFAMDAAETREIFALGRERGLVVAEAMWTRYLPFVRMLRRRIDEGVIGRVVFVEANIGHNVAHMPRLAQPSLGGGALLDLGVYALNFAAAFIGEKPSAMNSSRIRHETGVDAQNTVLLSYPSGAMATLSSSMVVVTDQCGMIYGEKGYFLVENIINPRRARLYSAKRELLETLEPAPQISGLEHEVRAVADAIRKGLPETPELPQPAVLETMELMDGARALWAAQES